MRAFIIDDEKIVITTIHKKLSENGFESTQFKSIKDFHKFRGDKNADIYIIDIGLPDGNGLDIVNELRSQNIQSPIIILSGYRGPEIRIQGLELGADDYLEKPFSLDELIARIKRLKKRLSPEVLGEKIAYNDYDFYPNTKKIYWKNVEIPLTKGEKNLVIFFMQNIGRLISKQELVLSVWNKHSTSAVSDNNINVNICKLRTKLGENFHLKTISGEGYILENNPEE